MKNSFRKHSLILLATTIFAVIFSGSINYSDQQYSNSDLNKYIAMAEESPGLNEDIIRPFVYRIGAPWIAGLMPFSISVNFYILNFLALLILTFSFYFFLIEFGIHENLSIVITIIFQLNKYFFLFLAWNHFQLGDTISTAILFLSFILIKRRNFKLLLFLMIQGVLIKEYCLMIIPAGFVYLYENNSKRSNLVYYGIISLLSILVFILVRVFIVSEGGESLFTQYTTQLIYYSKPTLLFKRFIVPFTPFGLLPLVFYKDLYEFFNSHKYFFVYTLTVILLSFFGEPERLMEPLAPVYYLFIAIIIYKYILKSSTEIHKNKIIAIIVFVSFLASFYHLWGIITFPYELYSIISTLFFTLFTTVIFYYVKLSIKNGREVNIFK